MSAAPGAAIHALVQGKRHPDDGRVMRIDAERRSQVIRV